MAPTLAPARCTTEKRTNTRFPPQVRPRRLTDQQTNQFSAQLSPEPRFSAYPFVALRGQDWRTALGVLESVEQEAAAAEAQAAAAAAVDSAPPQPLRQREVWCKQGLTSREDSERARKTVYNIVLDVMSARKRCVFF